MIITDIRSDACDGLYFGKVFSTLFDREIDVVLHGMDEDYLRYVDNCASYFNSMPQELLALLKKYSFRYCEDMRDFFDPAFPDVPENVSEETVLDYARVNCLIIEKPKDRNVIGFGVEFSCDWEREHGMEWTIRGDRVLYVGDFMGISPWYADRVYETECRSYVYEGFSL